MEVGMDAELTLYDVVEHGAALIAWAAGLFEGEGCIHISPGKLVDGQRQNPRVQLTLCSTDRDVVDRFRDVLGAGHVTLKAMHKRLPQHKQQYQYALGNNAETMRALELMRPWFLQRRATKADEAMAVLAWTRVHCSRGHVKPLDQKGCGICAAPRLALGPPASAAKTRRVACNRGHVYADGNEYIDPTGHRQCRRCVRDGQLRRKNELRSA